MTKSVSTPPPAPESTLPASQVLQLLEVIQRWQVAPEALLEGTGLRESDLDAPNARLPLPLVAELTERARTLTSEPGLGFYLGLHKRASRYGYVGFASMNASTLREALEIAVRFTPVLTNAISLQLQVEGELASLVIIQHAHLGSAQDVALFSLLVGWRQILRSMTGEDVELGRAIDIAMPEPSYFPRFAHLLPDAQFDQPQTRIVFDAIILDRPLPTPDRAAVRLAQEQCEAQLQALGFDASLVDRVRRLVFGERGVRTIEHVATLLHTSERTLKRRLAEANTSYSELLERERHERALLLLRSPNLSLDAVSDRLGYSSSPNFLRAFRRWTGTTPTQYRRNLQA